MWIFIVEPGIGPIGLTILIYKNGFGMFQVPPLGGWWIVAGILLISAIVIWGNLTWWKNEDEPPHFNAIVLLTFYGVFQLFYYWGRAQENNLLNVSMPGVLLGAHWLCNIRKPTMKFYVPEMMGKTLFFLSLTGLGLYLQFFIPDVAMRLSQNLIQM